MKANVDVEAGVCGFRTHGEFTCDDGQSISSCEVNSDCEKISLLAKAIPSLMPLDAYEEISPAADGKLLSLCRETLKGCCSGCAVPVGLFKGLQVAAGLALPKDVSIHIAKES